VGAAGTVPGGAAAGDGRRQGSSVEPSTGWRGWRAACGVQALCRNTHTSSDLMSCRLWPSDTYTLQPARVGEERVVA
jgi:hypothetical protein